jgi:hypothetical protein
LSFAAERTTYYSNLPIHYGFYECLAQSAYEAPTVTPTLPQRTFAAPPRGRSPPVPYEGYPYGGDDGGDKRDETPLFTKLDYLDYISHFPSTTRLATNAQRLSLAYTEQVSKSPTSILSQQPVQARLSRRQLTPVT